MTLKMHLYALEAANYFWYDFRDNKNYSSSLQINQLNNGQIFVRSEKKP